MDALNASNADLDRRILEMERERKVLRYPFQTLQELSVKPPAKRWLIKGIIASGETSAWIAPPGGMKSALLTEMAICAADQKPWHGRKAGMCAHVVYFALERADLVRRRLVAQCAQMGIAGEDLEQLGISVCSSIIDLGNPASVPDVIKTLEASCDIHGGTANLAIFDTFAKLVAAGGGDEDKAKDQGKVFANIQRLKERFPALHVALVGHTGKDVERGARGSNAILGDADVMVTISGDQIKTATITKANDLPEGPLFSFKGKVHEFGLDEDSDPITVNIISDETVVAETEAKRSGWTGGMKLVRDAICEALDQRSIRHTIAGDGPTVQAVEVSQARQVHSQRYVSTGTGNRNDAERKAWERNFKLARNSDLISGAVVHGVELIWLVRT